MRVYVESSAVLAWLLGEPIGDVVLKHLANAEAIFTSAITLLECERALIRARTVEEIAEEGLIDRRRVLTKASAHWHRVPLQDEILGRAGRPFPVEPIRTLDAIHLASALAARSAVPNLVLLSLDRRIREASASLGFEVVPS